MPKKKTIKIPVIRQLPSGAWTCQLRLDGESINITHEDYNIVYGQAVAIKSGVVKARKKPEEITLTKAIDKYIEARENSLSPSTIRGYRMIQKYRFQKSMEEQIYSLSTQEWQQRCNTEAKQCSAKTLSNAWRFLSSVIFAETGERHMVRLPQITKKERPFLDPAQIEIFINAIQGTSIEIPALLALCSLRSSEIKALTWKNVDLNSQTIYVRGSAVYDENRTLIYKTETKNSTSRRDVPMIPQLHTALSSIEHKSEYVVSLHGHTIYKNINKVCAKNGLPEVGLHGLRHSFASLAYHLGMPEKIAMEIGGWANDQTMHRIYTHVSKADRIKSQNIMLSYYQNLGKTDENANTIADEQ